MSMGSSMDRERNLSYAYIRLTAVFFILAIVIGIIKRYIFFTGQQLSYEHNMCYLLALGQSITGRLMAYGVPSGGISFPLGPLVFYFWSLLLHFWASPMCIMVLSFVLNLLCIALIFQYFNKRYSVITGLFGSSFLCAAMPHICLSGEILPVMMLPVSVIAWLMCFQHGIIHRNGPVFMSSFIFFAFAFHCNAEGYILLPVAVCIYIFMGGQKVRAIWLLIGVYLLLASYYFYINAEFENGFQAVRSFLEGLPSFFQSGTTEKTETIRIAERFLNFYRILGVIPGAAMIAALGSGFYIFVKNAKADNMKDEFNLNFPWLMLQFWGLAGLFFANKYTRFYLVFVIGSCGVSAWLFQKLFDSRYRKISLPAAAILLILMTTQPYEETRSSPGSHYTTIRLLKSMNHIFKTFEPNAHDFNNNFHTIVEDNVPPGITQLWGISTFLLSDSAPATSSSMDKHVLFFLKDNSTSSLDRLLSEVFHEVNQDPAFVFYDSDIDNGSWIYCPGRMRDRPSRAWLSDPSCRRFNRAFRSRYETEVYRKYPELEKDRADRNPPPWKPGVEYSIYFRLKSNSNVRMRYFIIQTTGCIRDGLLFENEVYKPQGQDIAKVSDEGLEYTCTTWFAIPSRSGWLGFQWLYDPKVIDSRASIPALYIDVIDIAHPANLPLHDGYLLQETRTLESFY
jgi:hypothetical protein